MTEQQGQKFCRRCGKMTLHAKRMVSVGCVTGILLTVLTAGIFLPFWAAYDILGMFAPWLCQTCGEAARKDRPSKKTAYEKRFKY